MVHEEGHEIRDDDMPDGMRAQRGVGDLEEDFRAVTLGFENMHERVPDPMVDVEPGEAAREVESHTRTVADVVDLTGLEGDLDFKIDDPFEGGL